MAPLRLRATGQPSACAASARSKASVRPSGSLTPVGDVDAFDDEHLALELDLSACVPHQTGGVDRPGREAPANVPVSQPPAAATTWSIVVACMSKAPSGTP